MNIARLIKALEKAGLKVTQYDCNEFRRSFDPSIEPFIRYFCESERYKCEFWPNGSGNERCCSVQVMRKNEDNDSQMDYFPGHFCKTIKDTVFSMIS